MPPIVDEAEGEEDQPESEEAEDAKDGVENPHVDHEDVAEGEGEEGETAETVNADANSDPETKEGEPEEGPANGEALAQEEIEGVSTQDQGESDHEQECEEVPERIHFRIVLRLETTTPDEMDDEGCREDKVAEPELGRIG